MKRTRKVIVHRHCSGVIKKLLWVAFIIMIEGKHSCVHNVTFFFFNVLGDEYLKETTGANKQNSLLFRLCGLQRKKNAKIGLRIRL